MIRKSVVAGLLLGLATQVPAGQAVEKVGRKADGKTPSVRAVVTPSRGPTAPNAVGTITYDNNVPFNRDGTDGGTVGNRFNGLINPHSVAGVTFRVAGNYAGSVVATVWDVNTASVMVLQRQLVTGIPDGVTMTVTMFTAMAALTMPVVGHAGDFIAGVRNTDYNPCAANTMLNSTCDGVALTMGGVDPGMGFHAARVPFTSANFVPTLTMVAGTGSNLGTLNGIFRATGDNLPVELMNFGVN